MKILCSNIKEQTQIDFFTSALSEHEVITLPSSLTLDIVNEHPDTEVLCVFVDSMVTSEMINALPQLKLITTRSTGFDHIDLEAARSRSIPVANVPFYGENTVAEHSMALMLALARRLPESLERTEDARFDYDGLRGWDLKGKKMGIIGGGHIGMHMARMCNGFNMEVLVFDIHHDEQLAQDVGFTYVELEELFAQADVISLHVPLNSHTQYLLDAPQFAQMKDGVFIINTARGGLIKTEALIAALQNGKVAGAGLDVLEEEDLMKHEWENISTTDETETRLALLNHMLMEHPHVIVTPHNAFNSNEAVQRIMDATVENIKAFNTGTSQNIIS